eukprot:3146451-Amphidinium_carterae.1
MQMCGCLLLIIGVLQHAAAKEAFDPSVLRSLSLGWARVKETFFGPCCSSLPHLPKADIRLNVC